MNKTIFLTGATGFVGGNLAVRILKGDSNTRLILLVRGSTKEDARRRFLRTLEFLYPAIKQQDVVGRIDVVCGDVTLKSMGLAESVIDRLAADVTHIIHSAATVQFHEPLKQARQINVHGTKNLMGFAQLINERGNLQRVAYIGTAYVSGDRNEMVFERELDCGQQFGNTYEQTKFEAESYVRSLIPRLPVTIFRPSIIVGDSKTGLTNKFNVLYPAFKLIYRGVLKIIPGSRNTLMDVVSVDYISEAIYHILLKTNEGFGKTYHLTAGDDHVSTAGEIADLTVEYFNQVTVEKQLESIRFLPAKLYRIAKRFLSDRAIRLSRAMEVYEPYLSVMRTFDNSNTLHALRGTNIAPLSVRTYLSTILQYCIETDWGRMLKHAV